MTTSRTTRSSRGASGAAALLAEKKKLLAKLKAAEQAAAKGKGTGKGDKGKTISEARMPAALVGKKSLAPAEQAQLLRLQPRGLLGGGGWTRVPERPPCVL